MIYLCFVNNSTLHKFCHFCKKHSYNDATNTIYQIKVCSQHRNHKDSSPHWPEGKVLAHAVASDVGNNQDLKSFMNL